MKTIILCCIVVFGVVLFPACQTTTTLPDGSIVVSTPDWSGIFQSVELALERYERIEARRDAAREAGDAERAERLDRILEAIQEAVERERS